jgi:hypothetical protein
VQGLFESRQGDLIAVSGFQHAFNRFNVPLVFRQARLAFSSPIATAAYG